MGASSHPAEPGSARAARPSRTVGLAMRTDVRVGGAGRKKTCCRTGCHGCPWTRRLDAKLTADLEVRVLTPPPPPPAAEAADPPPESDPPG